MARVSASEGKLTVDIVRAGASGEWSVKSGEGKYKCKLTASANGEQRE